MEIKSIQNYYKMQAATNSATTKKTFEEKSAPATDTRGTDTIDISAQASFKAALSNSAKIYSAENTREASSARISALKLQYQGDACPISGSDIAEKIIAGILGPGVKD